MTNERQLNVEPIISYPRQAQPGETYLLTVDLRFSAEDWHYEEEEYPVHCMLDTGELFSQEAIGDGAVILHRFGGVMGQRCFCSKPVKKNNGEKFGFHWLIGGECRLKALSFQINLERKLIAK